MGTNKDKHKIHPNSLANLTKHDGRPQQYEAKKQNKSICITPQSWEALAQLAEKHGCSSRSDFIEKLARGVIKLRASA